MRSFGRWMIGLLGFLLLAGCTTGTDWRAGQMGTGWSLMSQDAYSVNGTDGEPARLINMKIYIEPPVTEAKLNLAVQEILGNVRRDGFAHASLFFTDTRIPVPVLYNVAVVYFHPTGDNTLANLKGAPDYQTYEVNKGGVRDHVYADPYRDRPTDDELVFVSALHKMMSGDNAAITTREQRVLEQYMNEKEQEELMEISNRVWMWLLS